MVALGLPTSTDRSSTDSRTEMSLTSSMVTSSIDRPVDDELTLYGPQAPFAVSMSSFLPHAKRGVECGEQGCVTERLEQTFDGPFREQARTHRLIARCSDEHNRDRCRRRISSCCSSGPDMPGIATS